MAKKAEKSYQEAITELENILKNVEADDVSIDELSSMVQQSVDLIKFCKNKLKGIEQSLDDSFNSLEN